MGLPRRCLAAFQRYSGAGSFYLRDSPDMQACPFGARSSTSCASLPATRSIDTQSLGERPQSVKRANQQTRANWTHRGTSPVQTYGRKIFRPYDRNWWRLSACLFLPLTICGTGEKYFTPTIAIVTPSPDRHHGRSQSSIGSQTSSHLRSSVCRGEIFFARTSAICSE